MQGNRQTDTGQKWIIHETRKTDPEGEYVTEGTKGRGR